MERSLSNDDALRRYEAIEKAYCEGRWATVVEAGTVLLRELPQGGDHPEESKGLRHRMHLLMAHTLLHGYGDRDAAEDLYLLVHNSDAESSLRQMAEDGLDQCHKPLSSTFVAEETVEEDEEPLGRPGLFLPETEPNRPDDLAAPPERAKEAPVIALHLGAPPGEPSESEPSAEEANATPLNMRQKTTEPPDLGQAADPFQPASAPSTTETLHITVPVMPWATPEEATAEANVEAEASPPSTDRDEAMTPHLTLLPLIPEVVEEPELVEVHQATPSLAEEVDVEMTANGQRPAVADTPRPEDDLLSDEDDLLIDESEDLRSSLLLFKVG